MYYTVGGKLQTALERGLSHSLYTLPIGAKCINLQLEFSKWHKMAPSFCNACKPHNCRATLRSSRFCQCKNSTYHDSSKTWSLKNAMLYITSCSFSKPRVAHTWDEIVDPQYSILPSNKLDKMIRYALYLCLSVTYLRLPVSQCWSLTQLKKTSLHLLLTDSTQIILYPELEYISDDDLPRIVKPSVTDDNQRKHLLIELSDSELSMEEVSLAYSDYSRKHGPCSSVTRFKRRKKRRNRSRSSHC